MLWLPKPARRVRFPYPAPRISFSLETYTSIGTLRSKKRRATDVDRIPRWIAIACGNDPRNQPRAPRFDGEGTSPAYWNVALDGGRSERCGDHRRDGISDQSRYAKQSAGVGTNRRCWPGDDLRTETRPICDPGGVSGI